jgi:hypothetical protein
MEHHMADREQTGKRENETSEQSVTGRQQQGRAASSPNGDEGQQSSDADAEGGTASRPRGTTEDPDRTL